MAVAKPVDVPTMFCRRCRYPLNQLSRPSCPECGQAFDPANPKTYTLRAKPRRWPWFVALGILAFIAWFVFLRGHRWVVGGSRVVWHYVQWRHEQSAWAALRAGGATYIGPNVPADGRVPELIRNFYATHSPAEVVTIAGTPISDSAIDAMQRMPSVTSLFLIRPVVLTDAQLDRIARLSQLQSIAIFQASIPPQSIGRLKGLPALVNLSLAGSDITDASLEEIADFPSLRKLQLGETRVTDAGLGHLRRVKCLYDLGIADTAITDAGLWSLPILGTPERPGTLTLQNTRVTGDGLARLYEMKHLRRVNLCGSPVSAEAVERLRDRSPLLQVWVDESPEMLELYRKTIRSNDRDSCALVLCKPTTQPATPSAGP